MNKDKLRVKMLDRYSISYGGKKIEDTSKRSGKVWLLLAYLICNRGKTVSHDELLQQLWGETSNSNPEGTLKTTMWRVRQLLEELDDSFGHELIRHKCGGYCWNNDIEMEADFEEFERFCRAADVAKDDEARRNALYDALTLYHNDFLERYSSEAWVSPLTAYYNNLYVEAALKLLGLLQENIYASAAEQLCRAVLKVSPYHEEVYQYLMRSLIELRQFEKADEVYEELRDRLFANLGVMPDNESQTIHREILRHIDHQILSVDVLREQLQEKDPEPGPLFCEYHVFRQFYQVEARSVSRRGDAIHVGMLTIAEMEKTEMAQYVMEQTMEKLRQQIAGQLRQGDVVSRCSASQYVILLQANYENSNMVCERIIRAFEKANPYSPATIGYSVLSLEPLQRSAPKPQKPAGKKYRWN